jgi:hypothetical protein
MLFHNYISIQDSLKVSFLFVSVIQSVFILKHMPKVNLPAFLYRNIMLLCHIHVSQTAAGALCWPATFN